MCKDFARYLLLKIVTLITFSPSENLHLKRVKPRLIIASLTGVISVAFIKIFEKYPSAREENVYVLTELVGDELEILDPYGGSLQSYGLCYETMRKSIIKLVKLLNEGE